LTEGPQILVGSSLGGWLMLNVALARPARIAGLIGIAAAPDFTAELIWDSLDKTQQTQMQDTGQIALPNPYSDDPVVYPMALVTDGKAHLHLQAPVNITAPVHLLHGMQDDEVPWQTATRLAEKLASENVQVSLVRNAGHRFSEPDQIALLGDALDGMLAKLS
jgi:pimeloyl-ACP methyl ester carboxylesterase